MTRLLFATTCAVLLAGCAMNSSSSDSNDSFSMSTTLAHGYAEGATKESTFGVSAPGRISYEAVFTTNDVGGTMVCPLEDSGVKAEFLSPAGSVAATLQPDVRGVTGGGQCGSSEGTIDAEDASEVGDWTVRFSGQAELSVRIDIAASSFG